MPKLPQPLVAPQELARQNNEREAVFRAYLRRKGATPKPGRKPAKRVGRRAKALDDLLWAQAEREAKPVRAVGFFATQ